MLEDQAMKYWLKAAELRAIAADDEYAETREGLARIADTYEELARSMEPSAKN